MTRTRRCWCGSERLARFDDHYLDCRDCQTLVVAERPADDLSRVTDEAADFYGRRYWFEHQRELGQPDLEARAGADLHERCLHWLRTLLAYRLPPGRTLEIGCAHGAFVGLLQDVGFEALGLEISPWVAGYARRTFDVPVLEGPLEDQDLEPGSLDVLVAMDVLEHLADPAATVERAVGLLKDDGLLLIQTPCRPEGKSFDDLSASGDRFLEMLLPGEHLQLFGRRAIRRLLDRAGAGQVAFEPAIFGHYDMFVVAGRRPLAKRSTEEVRTFLSAGAGRRKVLAMLDLRELALRHAESFARADRDRLDRQRQVEELHGILEDRDRDRRDRQRQVEELHGILENRDRDRRKVEALLREEIERVDQDRRQLRANLGELEEAHARTQESFEELRVERERQESALKRLEVERDLTQRAVEELQKRHRELGRTLVELEREQAATRETLATLEAEAGGLRRKVAASEEALAHERWTAEELRRGRDELRELHARAVRTIEAADAVQGLAAESLGTLEARLARLEEHNRALREVAGEHRTSRIYRALVRFGRWRLFDDKLARALEGPAAAGPPDPAERTWRLGRTGAAASDDGAGAPTIAVDLTALLPGAENGGAKAVATGLVRAMSRLEPRWRFVLLTAGACHAELGALESDNVVRLELRPVAGALSEVLRRHPVDLLFCPMTAPPFTDPRVPLVCVIHDLQYRAYPEFFSSAERATRDRDFRRAARHAERLIAISDFVRRTVLESGELPAERVVTVRHGLVQSLPGIGAGRIGEALEEHGLEPGSFLLYPANFWPHKNHLMLLTAFGLFLHRHPGSSWKLVLTGADRPDPAPIRDAARRMGLAGSVAFPGFVPAEDLSALLRSCAALIFPSLYEGFGMPVLEAMAHGRPVLTSDVASLPEVAGGAAVLFDPRKPEDIAAAIERVAADPDLRAELRAKGLRRAAELGDLDRMAAAYRDTIRQVLESGRRLEDSVHGLHADGWTAPGFVVAYRGSETPRTLELEVVAPPGSAICPPVLTARASSGEVFREDVPSHRPLVVRCELPPDGGWLELDVEPAFIPAERGLNSDRRELGLKLQACRIGPRPPAAGTAVDLLEASGVHE